jgi:hypothetical protein
VNADAVTEINLIRRVASHAGQILSLADSALPLPGLNDIHLDARLHQIIHHTESLHIAGECLEPTMASKP